MPVASKGTALTLEDRIQRLEISNMYRAVTHRLIHIYDEQRAERAKDAVPGASPAEQGVQDGISFGVREAARALGCSTKTVHKLCQDDLLKFHWVGNKRRFTRQDIQDYRDGQRHVDSKPTEVVSSAADKNKGGDSNKIQRGIQGSDAELVTLKEVRDLCQQ